MPKLPISVTLDADNLTWLRARTASGKHRSLSDALDAIVSAARTSADGHSVRSVAGTIDINTADPDLELADGFVRAEFAASLARRLTVHEGAAHYATPAPRTPRRHPAKRSRRSRA